MTPRVLVTGAGGFVCRHIVRALLDTGFAVTAVDRAFDPDLRHQWANRVECVEADASDLPNIPVDYVIHGAAITADPNQARQTPEDNLRANLDPALNVLAWAQRHQVRRTVLISSSAVYRATEPGPVTEDMPAMPLGLYAVAKHTLETLAETLRTQYGRDVIAVRLSNVYGPAEQPRATRPRTSLIGTMVREALEANVINVPAYEAARDWTFAPDIGRAIGGLLRANQLSHHLYNVAAEQVLSPFEIVEAIHIYLPNVQTNVVWEQPADKLALTRRGYLSHERLQRDTGFNRWTSLADGIRQTIAWQRDHRVHTELTP
ncbi:MAG: NAD(P)-dependent oxidoreductase [Anaerolineae bacterium]|nr:NAD(P)-dependent oxidoreductase [Anaerolineae bacterium]